MDNENEITAKIAAKLKGNSEFNGLFTRMDTDFIRWESKSRREADVGYHTIREGKGADIQLTSNAPRTFANNVQSTLSASDMQIAVRMAEVQGEDMRENIGILERLLIYAFQKADERLINLLMGTLKENLVWYSIVRGWLAARFLVYKDGKDVVFDFLPYDPRWMVYQVGPNGLVWTGHITSSSPEDLEAEYGTEIKGAPWYKPWEKTAAYYNVIDYWKFDKKGSIWNAIVCNDAWLKEPEEYKLDSMPVLIAPVATRPPIRGEGASKLAGYGDSIFAPNREIDDLINKMGSVWASQANLLAKQPTINYYGKNGVQLKTTAYLAEAVLNLPQGENSLVEAPVKEISPTLVSLINWLDSMRIEGSMPPVESGAPHPSGTLYNLKQETANRIFNPQLRNLDSFYSNACRLIMEQLVAGGVGGGKIGKFKIQGQYKNAFFEDEITAPDLKRPHIVSVEFVARTPWTQMDTYQVADMAKRQGLPQSWINEHILRLQDPKYIADLSAMEMADHSPKLAMLASIEAYIKYGQPEKAQQMMQDMFNMQMQEDTQLQIQENEAEPEMPAELQEPQGGGI